MHHSLCHITSDNELGCRRQEFRGSLIEGLLAAASCRHLLPMGEEGEWRESVEWQEKEVPGGKVHKKCL